jgi:ribosomal RNA-processing protein 9
LETRTKEKIIKGFRHKRNGNCHFDEILTVCVSDDGGFIASAGKDRLIHVWKTDSFEHFACFKGHKDTVSAVKFAYNSHTLFSCSFDRTVKVWEVDDRVVLDTLHGHYSPVHDLDCFIHDKAFSCGFDCSVRMWKTAEESQLVYNGHTQSIDCIRIINVDTFITGGQDGNICVWKTGKKKPVSIVASPHDSCWITSLASLRNTDIVASGSYNGSINLYQFEGTLLLKSQIKVPGYITSLDFSKNGKYLIAGVSSDHKLGRWTETLKAKPGITVIQLNLSLQVT